MHNTSALFLTFTFLMAPVICTYTEKLFGDFSFFLDLELLFIAAANESLRQAATVASFFLIKFYGRREITRAIIRLRRVRFYSAMVDDLRTVSRDSITLPTQAIDINIFRFNECKESRMST